MRKGYRVFLAFLCLAAFGLLVAGCEKEKKPKPNERKPHIYKTGYEKHGLEKKRGDITLYTAKQLEPLARPTGPEALSIVVTGDIMLWDRLAELVGRLGYDYPFLGTMPLLKNADLTVGNLEGPLVAKAEQIPGRPYSYKVPPETVLGLTAAGFDVVSLANNHLLDCAEAGLQETIATLDKARIGWFGAGDSNEAARRPWIGQIKGVRVALIGGVSCEIYLGSARSFGNDEHWQRRLQLCKDHLTMIDGANTMGTFFYDPETLAQDVAAARAQADIVIVILHAGVRYWRPPHELQVALAQSAAKAGADLVIGHHAHIWQPVQMIGSVPVIYGIGNFAFGSGNRNADEGLLLRAIVQTDTKRLARVELFPTYIKNRDKQVNYQVRIFKDKAARDVLEDLRTWSKKLYGTDLTIVDDRIVIEIPKAKNDAS